LNQFSMDHYHDDILDEDHLRVATTTWGRWGFVHNSNSNSNRWTMVEDSESRVTIFRIPPPHSSSSNAGATPTTTTTTTTTTQRLEVVGNVKGLGKGERIYSCRFMGSKAYIVTFRQIDPFYTLDLSDASNPSVVGELKIPGYSNYLHPMEDDDDDDDNDDDNLVLAIGQHADEITGRTMGLQIAIFDVSDLSNPQQIQKYVEKGNEGHGGDQSSSSSSSSSSSEAQYDHKAFRYLPKSKLLILPASIYYNYVHHNNNNDKEDDGSPYGFDGFIVYHVDSINGIHKKFSIAHMEGRSMWDGSGCWSYAHAPARSLVFHGNITTLKGHTVMSHDLDTETLWWEINLDESLSETKDGCFSTGWF